MAVREPRFLVDAGVGSLAERHLSQSGYDVKTVRDINPSMDDRDILQLAVKEQRIVVTMDKDFGEYVFRSGLDHRGVLLLRMEDANGQSKARVLARIVSEHEDMLAGHFTVYQRGKLRIR
ncbi:MAG: DUF5615 family PIN-like protein [Chloroflexota bacterium]